MPLRLLPYFLTSCIAASLLILPNPSTGLAIGKATPMPQATEIPEIGDVDEALDDLRALLEAGENDDAIALAGRIAETDGESWQAYYYRGFAHTRLDDLENALADFDLALEIRPWDSGLWRLHGATHLKNKNPRAAKSDYKRSLFYNARAYQTYVSLVSLHERDVDKTVHNIFQAIVRASQTNAQGSGSRAIDILTETIDAQDRGRLPVELGYAYFTRANIWTRSENWDNARADLAAALELQPDMQDYYMARGFIFSKIEELGLAGLDFFQRMTRIERESIEADLSFSDSVTVDMNHGVVARLRFQGEAGQWVTIAARDYLAEGVDPLLVLLNPEGAPLLGNDDGGGELDSLISDYVLPVTGQYTAMVSHANAGYQGEIRVSLR